tara:strand:- start:3574 stop:3864 length:291 start_codon:yes stop_codon:yes gene_type:complete
MPNFNFLLEMPDSEVYKVAYVIMTALVGAIGVLWRMHVARWKESEVRYVECLKKHNDTQAEMGNVREILGELRGRVQIAEELKPKIDEIHNHLKNG